MANMNQFEVSGERPAACAVCEAMLPEAVDGLLSDTEQHAFDTHVASCVECAHELTEAQRGAAWLSLLKSQPPEPPAGLLAKILAGTTNTASHETHPSVAAPRPSVPAWGAAPVRIAVPPYRASGRPRVALRGPWVALRGQWTELFSVESSRATFQPRMAMTAAMAFFSIALTLNLTGVHLRDLRASDFTPSALKRSVADVDASATRMIQNNRAVYQVESRLSELRKDDLAGDSTPADRP